jgi:hypothetical protein
MSFPICKSVKVINNSTRSESIYKEVKDTEPQINKQTELKWAKRYHINVKI